MRRRSRAKPDIEPATKKSQPDASPAPGRLYPSFAMGDYLALHGPFATLADAPVTPVSGLAREQGALAEASNGQVAIDAQLPHLPRDEFQNVLAHEAVHLAQQRRAGRPAARDTLEAEARELAPAMAHGAAAWPSLGAASHVALQQEAGGHGPTAREVNELNRAFDAATGAANARRREHLLAQQEYLRKLRALVGERHSIETNRTILDQYSVIQAAVEASSVDQDNRRPISISVSPEQIQFVVRFQVRFKGLTPEAARLQFPILRQKLSAGIARVWGQSLDQLPSLVRGREFLVTPIIDLVPADAPRNPDYWLVDVDPSVPRARTDPGDGSMTISPRNIGEPDTLGHETLHLAGLIDRYLDNSKTKKSMGFRGSGKPGTSTGTTRGDPLDVGRGAILSEDLEFVFVHMDVYERVILEDMTPYHMVLMRHMGWGHAPRLRELIQGAKDAPDPEQRLLDTIDHAADQVAADLSVETERDRLRRESALPVPGP